MSVLNSPIKLILSSDYLYLKNKIDFVVKTFLEVYSVTKKTTICLGTQRNNSIIMFSSDSINFFIANQGVPDKIIFTNWYDQNIPILFQDSVIDPLIKDGPNNCTIINADILSNAFYFLSCWQEFVQSDQDSMGRFPFKSSLTNELGVATIPVVNYYFDILKRAIQDFHGSKKVVSFKQKEGLKVGLTHDIDQCKTGWKEDNFRLIKNGKLITGISNIVARLFHNDIWFNFSSIKDSEKKKSISSSFYLIADDRKSGPHTNADYRLESIEIQNQMNELLSEGFELGIHGSIGTGFDSEKLKAEIQKFQLNNLGGRFHYLMMRIPETWKIIEKSGLIYDSTLGFAEMIGFRNGYCYPFQPYDFENDTHYSFWEYPMNVMDKTLMQPEYLHLKPSEAIVKVQTLIDEIHKWNGFFILNWHNNTLSGFKYREWVNVYNEIIEYCLALNSNISSIINHHHSMCKVIASE